MTSERHEEAAQYSEGYRLGAADARAGQIRYVCGGPATPERAQWGAGYAAGHRWASKHPASRPEPEYEAGQ